MFTRLRLSTGSHLWSAFQLANVRRLVQLLPLLLGPYGVKAAQYLAGRVDLLPKTIADQFLDLQCSVSPLSTAALHTALTSLRESMPGLAGSHIDEVPVGSGALCQVHRCRLAGGEEVALKFLKPGVETRMRRAAPLLMFGAHSLDRLFGQGVLGFAISLQSALSQLQRQCDLRIEAEILSEMKGRFGWTPAVKFPLPISGLTSKTGYCQEFVEGAVSIHRIPDDRRRVAACVTALHALYKMIFEDGLVHLDLHGGNVLCREADQNGQICIVDCGMWTRIDTDTRLAFKQLFRSLVDGDGANLASASRQLSMQIHEFSQSNDVYASIARRHQGLSVSEFSLIRVVRDILGVLESQGRRPTFPVLQILLALAAMEATLKRSAPCLDFQAAARDFVGLSPGMHLRNDPKSLNR